MKGKSTELQTGARNAYFAQLFLRGLNQNYKEDINDLGKAYINGQNNYPKDMESALAWITSREEAGNHNRPRFRPNRNILNENKHDDDGSKNVKSFYQTAVDQDTSDPPDESYRVTIQQWWSVGSSSVFRKRLSEPCGARRGVSTRVSR